MSFKAEAILFLMILALEILIAAGYVLIAAAGFAFSSHTGIDVAVWAVGAATILVAIAFFLMARERFAVGIVKLARKLATDRGPEPCEDHAVVTTRVVRFTVGSRDTVELHADGSISFILARGLNLNRGKEFGDRG